jgi:methylmalonyl-CoA mutase
MVTEHLLEEFAPVSTEAWEQAIHKDLKGADYTKKLIWQSDEGLAAKPYYRKEDIAFLSFPPSDALPASGVRTNGEWHIREEIDAVEAEIANQSAQRAVAAGAEQIAFLNANVQNSSDLGLLLVNLENIPIHFQNADQPLLQLLPERQQNRPEAAPFSSGWNPLDNPEFAAELLLAAGPAFVPFSIDGLRLEDAGATAVEEIGILLAAAIDYLSEMTSRNIDSGRAAAAIEFSFSIGANYFFQIAKFRAFRSLWANVIASFQGRPSSAPARIHARTSRWNETIYDPHVNILRATTEAMSAAVGGVDSITVAAFDECYKAPDEAGRRWARNTQIILKQEALLARVSDPGAGSYYLETISNFLEHEGWKLMQQIEAAGGYRKATADGLLARILAEKLAARNKAIAQRRRVFTGTTQYANTQEKALHRIDESRASQGQRGAQSFEHLRLRTERHAARTGKTPKVLLAAFGEVTMSSARSAFAQNFFACAGFEIVTKRFQNTNEMDSGGADLIVLCSSDPEYPKVAAEVLAKLRLLNLHVPVLVAGNPESAEQLRQIGISDFIHVRSNPIDVLTTWQQRLGIEAW